MYCTLLKAVALLLVVNLFKRLTHPVVWHDKSVAAAVRCTDQLWRRHRRTTSCYRLHLTTIDQKFTGLSLLALLSFSDSEHNFDNGHGSPRSSTSVPIHVDIANLLLLSSAAAIFLARASFGRLSAGTPTAVDILYSDAYCLTAFACHFCPFVFSFFFLFWCFRTLFADHIPLRLL